MKSLKDVKAKLLANPAVRQAYDAQTPEFELARELIAARTQAGLTQGDVAARMGTTQSVVARIESGRGTPSMRTVQRFASAVVRMEPLTAAGRFVHALQPSVFWALDLNRCALAHGGFRLGVNGALSFNV